jgi:hypothetical protein
LGRDLFNEEFEAESGLTVIEALGKYIIWRNQKIGCVSDFNENGKEELYLYASSGLVSRPQFFEFDGTGFAELLDIGVVDVYFTGINPIEKIIDIRIDIPINEGIKWDFSTVSRIIENNSYIWDTATQRYKLLTGETKRYRWNNNVQKYEEIEQQ